MQVNSGDVGGQGGEGAREGRRLQESRRKSDLAGLCERSQEFGAIARSGVERDAMQLARHALQPNSFLGSSGDSPIQQLERWRQAFAAGAAARRTIGIVLEALLSAVCWQLRTSWQWLSRRQQSFDDTHAAILGCMAVGTAVWGSWCGARRQLGDRERQHASARRGLTATFPAATAHGSMQPKGRGGGCLGTGHQEKTIRRLAMVELGFHRQYMGNLWFCR